MSENSKPLVLVDGSSYLFRAYHALPPLVNTHGEPTGAMHGVLNMLDKLRRDYEPEHMAVVFDAKGKTFRNDLYPEYKANRPPMPDDLRVQIEPLLAIIKAQGYPLIIIDYVEADDVIGTLSVAFEGDVIISTGDKDMAQLVNQRVSLINTMSDEFLDVEGVKAKFGVPPNRIRDYLSLMGDKVDNVPGVDKVGPKTAVKWLGLYDSLQGVMDNAEQIKGKVGENLRTALDFLPLSYELVTIKCDVELDCRPEMLCFCKQDDQRLIELYERYGFRSRLARLQAGEDEFSEQQTEVETIEVDYQTLLTQAQMEEWLAALQAADYFAFDTETTSLDYMQAEVVGFSFAIEAGKAAYLPLAHDYEDAPEQLDRDAVFAQWKAILEDPSIKKVGQNLKYDRSVLLNHGIELQGIADDTMLESYVLDSTASRHDMDSLCKKHLNHETIHFEDIAGKGKKQLTFNQIPLEQAAPYAAEDADMTLRLHQLFSPQLADLAKQQTLYRELELPLLTVLSDIERNGVKIDGDSLLEQSAELKQQMDDIEKQVHDLAGEVFNLSSTKQLQSVLFDEEKLNLPILKKTPKGAPSTAEEVLQELANDHEVPRLIMDYRGMSKLKSTYTDKLPLMVKEQTGRVHTSYHQAVTATGRLSSTDPNLQNIPVRTAAGRRIRQAFIANGEGKIFAADYSQIELRIMAHLSADEGLLNAFAAGQDIHKATASEIFGVELDAVETEQRRAAKAVNFGLIYGMSAFGLAKQLGVERGVAQEYINRYFARYPGVKTYMDTTRALAKEQGYVETLFGRRLYLPDINHRNAMRRQYAERTAINAPMQGTAADIIKKAMIAVHDWMKKDELNSKMIMQVHDELVFELVPDELDLMQTKVTELMTNAADLAVPLVVDTGIGDSWDEAH